MRDPFPLSTSEFNQFVYDLGNTLQWLPSWGGIYQWHNRYILAYVKPDYSVALTDISGGIPSTRVPGGMIPVSVLLENVPRVETTALEAFFYSLPSNFMAIAAERMNQIGDIAVDVVETAGEAAGAGLRPLMPALLPLAVIAGAAFLFMYAPRRKGN
jgi:hypothetical protein